MAARTGEVVAREAAAHGSVHRASRFTEALKRRLVGTVLGDRLEALRDRLALVRSTPAQMACQSNDFLASRLVKRLCAPGGTFVDVGAHLGSVVAGVLRHSPSARVVAIEPIPWKARALARKFPRVEVHACALGSHDGDVSFYVVPHASAYSSLGRIDGSVEIRVPSRCLDQLVSDASVLKVDVEGAELMVLHGAESLVARSRPIIMFESAPGASERLGMAIEELFDWFTAQGYVIVVPNRLAHDGPPLSREGFVEAHLFPRRSTNFFGVPHERREEVRNLARTIVGVR